jgi:hypothetical protein
MIAEYMFFLRCRNLNPKQDELTTERSKVHYLLTRVCAQKARRQLKDWQAEISGLSEQRFQS